MVTINLEDKFRQLIGNDRAFVEALMVVGNKQRQIVPFTYNTIQDLVDKEETGTDIYVKPSQVGFSTERIYKRLASTLTNPGTNTVLVAYEDFITQRLLGKVSFAYNHLKNLNIPGFPELYNDCFPYNTNIRLADGNTLQIGKMVNQRIPANVLSCNLGTGDVEPKRVVGWSKRPSRHTWFVLGSSKTFSHMMTPNHHIYIGDGWKMAGDVEIGETTYHYGFIPNDDQKQLIIGSLLGDAYLDPRPNHGGVQFGQANALYLYWKHDILKGESSIPTVNMENGYSSTPLYMFRLSSSPFYDLYSIDELDAKGLAVWFCDDGNTQASNEGVKICTHGFPLAKQESLCRLLLDKFGVQANLRLQRVRDKVYWYIVIPNPRGSYNHDRFFRLIAPYVPDCMNYKIPERFRSQKYKWDNRFGYGLVPYKVAVKDLMLTSDKGYNYEYSIEVADNHNFFTSAGLCKNSEFLKTFRFVMNGKLMGISSIYIASARSKTAGRTEAINHLLLDEHAFYVPEATERVIAPAMARIPPGGTVDSFSTPNGEENEFHDWYVAAKQGTSVFTAHFYPWYLHQEYRIVLGDKRIREIPETDAEEFKLNIEEETLFYVKGLDLDQIRWRRWMMKLMESLRRRGETRTLFKQEFPEDDLSCFLATGDMYHDTKTMDELANSCYPAPDSVGNLLVWHKPEKDRKYMVAIDPGQQKITQSALVVLTYIKDEHGNDKLQLCARDAGLYSPEVTVGKAKTASDYYNKAEIAWEANSHGLALTELLKDRRPIYYRKDIVSGVETKVPGWLTTNGNKPYMLQQVDKSLYSIDCSDLEFIRQCRNHRLVGDKVDVVGPNDIYMAVAVGICCLSPIQPRRGFIGRSGWKW